MTIFVCRKKHVVGTHWKYLNEYHKSFHGEMKNIYHPFCYEKVSYLGHSVRYD